MREFFSTMKDLLLFPIELIRDGEDWVEKTLGVFLGACYTGLAVCFVALGIHLRGEIKNAYEDKDAAGNITTIRVDPDTRSTMHRLNPTSATYVSFDTRAICDVAIHQEPRTTTTFMFCGKGCMMPVTSTSWVDIADTKSCKSFNDASKAEKAEIQKMAGYLQKSGVTVNAGL